MKIAILVGSVYGTAKDVAEHAKTLLQAQGHEVWLDARGTYEQLQAFAPQAFLMVTATTGMGELPNDLQPLYYSLRDQLPNYRGQPAAVLALGDSSYADTYCGAGELLRELLQELGLNEVLPMLKLDASETVSQEQDCEPWVLEFATKLA